MDLLVGEEHYVSAAMGTICKDVNADSTLVIDCDAIAALSLHLEQNPTTNSHGHAHGG